jgi:GAF domain-containing protein
MIDKILTQWFDGENNFIMNAANFCAVLNDNIDNLNWVGFYMYSDGDLILSAFQGKAAYRRIKMGSGVVGTAAKNRKTEIVGDVEDFEGHIVCDVMSKSEIVVPIIKDDKLYGVLDIDSPVLKKFTPELSKDIEGYLEQLISASDLEQVWDYYNK